MSDKKLYEELEIIDQVMSSLSDEEREREVGKLMARLDSIKREDIEAVVVGLKIKGREGEALIAMAGRRGQVLTVLDVMCGKVLEMDNIYMEAVEADEKGEVQ